MRSYTWIPNLLICVDSEQNLPYEIEVLKKYGSRNDSLLRSNSEGARWSQSEINPEMEVMDSVIGESVVPIDHQNVTEYPRMMFIGSENRKFKFCADLEVPQRGHLSMEPDNQAMEWLSNQRVRSRPTKGPRDQRPPPPSIFHLSHVPRAATWDESPPFGRLRCQRLPSHLSEVPRAIREGEYLKEKGQRILFLDGGGVKVRTMKYSAIPFITDALLQGLIQIEMLKAIEQMTGKSISELFDWVVGTSTGGILALGMIYGETLAHY